VRWWVPSDPAAGVKLTEQASVPDPGRVQLAGEKVPVPPEKVTVPEGRMVVPESVSVTVAVQVDGEFTGTEDGEQLTEVDVVRVATPSLKVPLEVEWSVSPE
jgi:hypothetical protein